MSKQCEEIRREYQNLKTLRKEFDLEYQKAVKTGNLTRAKELKAELEQERDALWKKLWPFEALSRRELKEQYNLQADLCQERGFFRILSNGQKGIKDEKGNEYPWPTIYEVIKKLKSNELFREKIETFENPFILITPFALSPEKMKDEYSKQIEEHFIEERVEGDKRIPNKSRTKLFGVDKEPLPLRTDKENVHFNDSLLKKLSYFPEWVKKEGSSVRLKNSLTKEQAVAKIGGWSIAIIENIPKVPQRGRGKTIEKEIKVRGKTIKVKRKQVEGGLTTFEQYQLLKQQNEQGLTLEEWFFLAMLYLKENNIVLDDDEGTAYHCRLLGANTADGLVPDAHWYHYYRQACLDSWYPETSSSGYGVRAAVRV